MKIEELLAVKEGESLDVAKVIAELKTKRYLEDPKTDIAKKQLDPLQHDVFDKMLRKDKKVKIDPDDPEYASSENVIKVVGSGEQVGYRTEPVARIALAIQKLIVKRAVSFLFGNPVGFDADIDRDETTGKDNQGQAAVLKALKRIMYDVKEKSFNRKVARNLISCTEVAELWYPVEKKNTAYGFPSKYKLRVAIFSPILGDTLYPYFDETGDMVAFSREFSITEKTKTKNFFETYTDHAQYMFEQGTDGWVPSEGYPKENTIGKIPVIFGSQPDVEWADVQVLIDRLEKLLSNFADTNDYHAAPKIFVKGELTGFSKKGETGAILQGDENSSAEYLSWENAPESVKLEIDTLLRMIYTLTQTPDISFESVKGIGAVSGIALKLLFMDAHLKVADHQEVFDEYLQRRINVVKAFIGKFSTQLAESAENLQVEPVITPYMIRDEAAEIKIWQDANGGNPVMSQKASFSKAALTADPEADYEQYKEEDGARSSFNVFEPTPA
ncbi:phage portal protein [bacterium]|jgi:SPP1 family phage portal protein|nr:phage portal protein [bacterium]